MPLHSAPLPCLSFRPIAFPQRVVSELCNSISLLVNSQPCSTPPVQFLSGLSRSQASSCRSVPFQRVSEHCFTQLLQSIALICRSIAMLSKPFYSVSDQLHAIPYPFFSQHTFSAAMQNRSWATRVVSIGCLSCAFRLLAQPHHSCALRFFASRFNSLPPHCFSDHSLSEALRSFAVSAMPLGSRAGHCFSAPNLRITPLSDTKPIQSVTLRVLPKPHT